MVMLMRRGFIALAGIFGALGVATAAMASHGEEVRNLAAISSMALAHAPVLLIIGLVGRGRVLTGAGLILAAGCVIFVADLAMRQWTASPLFLGAAPIGGGGMILGWLGIVSAAVSKAIVHD
jgi:uncharacterized membrane protein YgdD (TMEM256/DUF423 family)